MRSHQVLTCAVVIFICADTSAAAQTMAPSAPQMYPAKPLRMIVPFPPGGGNDILARSVAQRLSAVVGQPVVIDNRGGAGGLLGAELAAQAAPDGYTLFLASVGNLAFNPALHAKLPYDPIRDFAPVTTLASSPFIMVVNPSVAARSVKELITLAKSKPGALNYASAGQGSSLHLTGEIFKLATGTNLVHVAYKGSAQALTDLLGGQVQIMFGTMGATLPQVKAGKLRALGVSSAMRTSAAPDVPTIAEAGVSGFEVLNWYGIAFQSRIPLPILQKLHRDLLVALKLPDMLESFATQGLDPAPCTPAEFSTLIKSEIAKYARVVKAADIRAE